MLAAAGVGMAAPSWGADLVNRAQVDLESTVTDMTTVEVGSASRLLVSGPSRLWLVDPQAGSVLSSLPGGADAVVAGGPELAWTCGADGVASVELGSKDGPVRTVRDAAPCRDLGLVATADGRALVAVGDQIRVLSVEADLSLTLSRTLDGTVGGWPVVGVDGKRFAVASDGVLLEEGPWGTSKLATGGAVGGLVSGPSSWTWSLIDEAALVDVTRRRIEVGAGPGHLSRGDLNGDGRSDLVIAHPDMDTVGVILGGEREEQRIAAMAGVRRAVPVSSAGGACADLAVVTASGKIRVLSGFCEGQPVANRPLADGTAPTSPLAVTPPTGPGPVQSSARQLAVGAGEWPLVNVKAGDRLDMRLRDVEGTASAWAASGGPAGLVVTSSGSVMYRSRDQDVGRWRVSLRMWENGSWARRTGFELVVLPGEGQVAVGNRVGLGVSDISKALDEEVGKLERPLALRGCSVGIGGVIGGTKVEASWVLLGESFLVSGSPALAMTCDGGASKDPGFWWFGGLDMAPWFVYVVSNSELRHGLAASVGGGYARGPLYAGLYGTAGATVLGFGPIVRWLPFERENGRRHGPELRVLWLPANEFVMEGMLLYTFQLGRYR